MKTVSIFALILCAALASFGQQTTRSEPVSFDTLVGHLKRYGFDADRFRLPLIYKEKKFEVALSAQPISFQLEDVVLKNPFGGTYPLAYSVIYQDHLVSLFEPGKFVCLRLPSLRRNGELENRLNTTPFQYHWMLGGKLVAEAGGRYLYFTGNHWAPYTELVPLKRQPRLFEDDRYIAFGDCHGEWGGTIYFYNKQTKQTHYTAATCANTVVYEGGRYLVLSSLGHMMGDFRLHAIANPEDLPVADPSLINKTVRGGALGYTHTTKAAKLVLGGFDMQAFSRFAAGGRMLYMINWRGPTFLAEVRDSTVAIVHPLFNDGLYTHRPVTATYGRRTLINMDFWGTAREREVAVMIVDGNRIMRINWNEKHKH